MFWISRFNYLEKRMISVAGACARERQSPGPRENKVPKESKRRRQTDRQTNGQTDKRTDRKIRGGGPPTPTREDGRTEERAPADRKTTRRAERKRQKCGTASPIPSTGMTGDRPTDR